MNLVLDTDILIDIEKGQNQTKSKLELLSREYPSSPQITFINLFEFLLGIEVRSEHDVLRGLKPTVSRESFR